MNAVILAACLLSQVPPDAVWYDERTMPPVYQNGRGGIQVVGYNPSVTVNAVTGEKAHPFGAPSNHFPWRHVGGTPDGGPAPGTVKALWLPKGSKVQVWLETKPWPHQSEVCEWRWRFPVGAIRAVRLLRDDGIVFSEHVSTKVRPGDGISCWEGTERILATPPAWYRRPSNCVECHQDVAEHAERLRPKEKNYYNRLRGWDGVVSWHPFKDAHKADGGHMPARIRTDDPQISVSPWSVREAEKWHARQDGVLTIAGERR